MGELEITMSSRELRHWMIYEATVSPLPDRLADGHNALLCSIVVNLARSSDAAPVVPADFYFIRDPHEPKASEPPADGLTEAERLRAIYYGGR